MADRVGILDLDIVADIHDLFVFAALDHINCCRRHQEILSRSETARNHLDGHIRVIQHIDRKKLLRIARLDRAAEFAVDLLVRHTDKRGAVPAEMIDDILAVGQQEIFIRQNPERIGARFFINARELRDVRNAVSKIFVHNTPHTTVSISQSTPMIWSMKPFSLASSAKRYHSTRCFLSYSLEVSVLWSSMYCFTRASTRRLKSA